MADYSEETSANHYKNIIQCQDSLGEIEEGLNELKTLQERAILKEEKESKKEKKPVKKQTEELSTADKQRELSESRINVLKGLTDAQKKLQEKL